MKPAVKVQTLRVSFIVLAILAGTVAIHFASARQAAAPASALRVFTSDGFKPSLEALIPQLERSIGCKVLPEFESSKALEQRIHGGEPFDVAILSSNVVDDLTKEGEISAATRRDLGRAGIGVGLRKGAPRPDISTPEAMKRTLLSAKSIAFNRDGASAVHINEMVERLGIADTVRPKFMLEVGAGEPQRDVASGKAEMVITLIPEIADFQSLELVGPLPGDLQSYVPFSAGISAHSRNAAAAKGLIQFLASPAAASTLKSKGIEPR